MMKWCDWRMVSLLRTCLLLEQVGWRQEVKESHIQTV